MRTNHREYTWADLHALYKLSDDLFPTGSKSNMQPRYNIAPTQDVDFVALDKGSNLEPPRGRWRLVPFWAEELPKATLFNARIETHLGRSDSTCNCPKAAVRFGRALSRWTSICRLVSPRWSDEQKTSLRF